jgi:hypothetical protein
LSHAVAQHADEPSKNNAGDGAALGVFNRKRIKIACCFIWHLQVLLATAPDLLIDVIWWQSPILSLLLRTSSPQKERSILQPDLNRSADCKALVEHPFRSLSFARVVVLLITWTLGTLVIAGPKVLEFYEDFRNHPGNVLNSDGKEYSQ